MKKYLFLLLILFSCKDISDTSTIAIHKVDSIQISQLSIINKTCADSCYILRKRVDSMSVVIDTLKTKLFLSNYKIEKITFYTKICLKNPTQDKFLKGWIRRTLEF